MTSPRPTPHLRWRAYLRHPKVHSLLVLIVWAVVIFGLIISARWYLLPQVNRFKEPIAEAVGEAIGCRVEIGALVPRWDTLWPRLSLRNVVLSKPDAETGNVTLLRLPEVEASIYWQSLLGELRFHNLTVADASLTVRRLSQYVYDIAGFKLDLTPADQKGKDASDASIASSGGSPVANKSGSALSWLLSQGRLSIIDSAVVYHDLTDPDDEVTVFNKIDFTFENQPLNYAVGLQAELAGPGHNTIDVRASFATGLSGLFEKEDWRKWKGRIYFEAQGLDVARFVEPSDFLSPVVRRGHGNLRAWMDFADARPVSITGDVAMKAVQLELPQAQIPLEFNEFSAQFSETLEGDALTFETQNLAYELADGTRAQMPRVSLKLKLAREELQARSATVEIAETDLAAIRRILPSLPLPEEVARVINERAPSGLLRDTRIDWRGALTNPAQWSLVTHFSNLTVEAVAADKSAQKAMTPGFANLSGALQATVKSGRLSLNAQNASLTFPGIFEHPTIVLDSLQADAGWTMAETGPVVTVDNLHAVNADADVSASGSWRRDPAAGSAGVADITGTIARGSASSVWKYMPLVIGKSVRDWLQHGLVDGTARDGRFVIRGPLKNFPWVDAASAAKKPEDDATRNLFLVEARVENGTLDYVPHHDEDVAADHSNPMWPLLTNINGRMRFEGLSMRIEADSARTFGADVGPATAVIAKLNGGHDTLLEIEGRARGDLQRYFDYLEASPVGGFMGHALRSTKAEGKADLKLTLAIPLLHAHDTRVAGAVTMAGNRVEMPHPVPPLAEVSGTVNFNEKGASAKNVLARPFGKEDATINVVTAGNGTISIAASGSIDVKDINYFAPTPIVADVLSHAKGTTPFVATTTITPGSGVTVTAQSSLKGVSIALPAPLMKPASASWPMRFSASPITIRQEPGLMISVASDKHFDVLLQLPAGMKNGRPSKLPVRGSVGIGARNGLPAEGFSLDVRAKTVSMVDWSGHIRSLIDAATGVNAGANSAAKDTKSTTNEAEHLAAALTRVRAEVDEAVFSDSSLKNLRVDYERRKGDWTLSIDSDRASGKIAYDDADAGYLRLDMPKLSVSKNAASVLREFIEGDKGDKADDSSGASSAARQSAGLSQAPRALPRISAHIGELDYDGRYLGEANLETSVNRQGDVEGLKIDKASLRTNSGSLTATGSWARSFAQSAADKTMLDIHWNIDDMGGLLAELGFPGVIEAARGTAQAKVSFTGAPWSPKMDTLEGDVALDFAKGSFVEVNTGPGGAVLSLLSFQSLLRRLTLDFSDLVQKGFSFDRFTGTAVVKNGVSTTENTKIVGSQATVLVSGSVDLARRQLNSRAVVLPDINAGNASIALAFVNPAVGIGTFLAQLLLRNPLSRIFKVEYDITGSMDNPVISKVNDNEDKDTADKKKD